jgi:ion channel
MDARNRIRVRPDHPDEILALGRMTSIAVGAGVLMILVILWDAFETIVLSRRVSRKFRLTRLFYRSLWGPWRALARQFPAGNRRENFLMVFGPLSLILLLAAWAAGLVVSFALLHWGLGSQMTAADGSHGLRTDLYMSGTTFFTLGLGDVTPRTSIARLLTVVESGMGFGFLALVIGYLPTVSQAFSRREVNITLLDARAGSPPTAAQLLRRHSQDGGSEALCELLSDWERWSAELLESHVSFPVLSYFRSQHDNQSWVAALTTILDACALSIAGLEKAPARAARLTFAMARHAVLDLCAVFRQAPAPPQPDRLPASELARLRQFLTASAVHLREDNAAEAKLASLRAMYEPYINALAQYLLMPLPDWIPPPGAPDVWHTTA